MKTKCCWPGCTAETDTPTEWRWKYFTPWNGRWPKGVPDDDGGMLCPTHMDAYYRLLTPLPKIEDDKPPDKLGTIIILLVLIFAGLCGIAYILQTKLPALH
jgi:hypothetical protein